MKGPRASIAALRREQIVEAAVAIIDEQGLQHLSLSEIEKKAQMSRGQLTYYFPAKEEILLAVFDRLLQLMKQRVEAEHPDHPCGTTSKGWERLQAFLSFVLLNPPEAKEFHSLQYTFLSQIGHREDFRQRLADLYESWRSHMAKDLTDDLADKGRPGAPVSPRTFATLVQAILHGLAMQRVADPRAYDRQEMVDLCLDLLGSYLKKVDRPGPAGASEVLPNEKGTS
jgi:AcrR family transcriptional regulator